MNNMELEEIINIYNEVNNTSLFIIRSNSSVSKFCKSLRTQSISIINFDNEVIIHKETTHISDKKLELEYKIMYDLFNLNNV